MQRTLLTRSGYWQVYYAAAGKEAAAPLEPSSFARFVQAQCMPTREQRLRMTVLDLGCGNGRDVLFYAAQGVRRAHGIDAAAPGIEIAKAERKARQLHNATFTAMDFRILLDERAKADPAGVPIYSPEADIVTLRFVLHAVDAALAARLLRWIVDHVLPPAREKGEGGWLCIEARSRRDPMAQKGTPVPGERDAYTYAGGHYRRFLCMDTLRAELETGLGLVIVHAEERAGLAPLGTDDPVLIRILARK